MNLKATVVWIGMLLAATAAVADETDPAEIFKKVTAAYAALDTYAAEGKVVSDIDSGVAKVAMETTFTIKLKKPNAYLITWEQKNAAVPNFTQSGAVWSNGTQPYLYMGFAKAYSKMTSDEMALGSATGISGGAASTIPSLVLSAFEKQPAPFSRLVEPKLQADERVEDDDCYVISGSSPVSKNETYWISKTSSLIRRYSRSLESPEGGVKVPEMTDQQLDEAIKGMGQEPTKERKEAMKKMMTEARDRVKTMNLKGTSTETQQKITSPKLAPEDFEFKLPEGTILKDSLFGGVLGGK